MRIMGWMGRADQTTKVKGMFIHPEQIADIGRRHPEVSRLRLVVTRENERDLMSLLCAASSSDPSLQAAIERTLQEVTKLSGRVKIVDDSAFPNDGLVIADERSYEKR